MMKFIKKRVLAVVSLFLVLTLLPVLPKTMAVSQGKMISQTREQLDAERYIVTTLYDIISLVCHYQADNLCGRVGEEDALPGVFFHARKIALG